MENINYRNLYKLQDIVLKIIFSTETEFYLTGGTCLNRFFFNKRYSDDLDFFTNYSNQFSFSFKEILFLLSKNSLEYQLKVDAKDFKKILVIDKSQKLQLDFVNDRVKRFGAIISKEGYNLDNIENILSNKITAVISRDNPKDVFDIFLISLNVDFAWEKILSNATEKMFFEKEYLIYRLKEFPKILFEKIKLIDSGFLNNFDEIFPMIINNIKDEKDNKSKILMKRN